MKVYVWHVILSWFSDAGGKKEKNAAVCPRVCRRRMAAISMVCDSRAGQVRPHCFCRVCRLVLRPVFFVSPVCAVLKKRTVATALPARVGLMATDEPVGDKKDGEVMAVRVKSHTLPNGTPGLRLVAE